MVYAFVCIFGSFFQVWCSWWDCFLLHSSNVTILSGTHIVIGWVIWCSWVSVFSNIWVRVSGSTIFSCCMIHNTYVPPLVFELHIVTKLGSSGLMKFLSSVHGLRSYLVMILYILVWFQVSCPVLLPSWSCGREIHVVPLVYKCANLQLWEMTTSSLAHRYDNTLSWLPFGLHSGTSWLLGSLKFRLL